MKLSLLIVLLTITNCNFFADFKAYELNARVDPTRPGPVLTYQYYVKNSSLIYIPVYGPSTYVFAVHDGLGAVIPNRSCHDLAASNGYSTLNNYC